MNPWSYRYLELWMKHQIGHYCISCTRDGGHKHNLVRWMKRQDHDATVAQNCFWLFFLGFSVWKGVACSYLSIRKQNPNLYVLQFRWSQFVELMTAMLQVMKEWKSEDMPRCLLFACVCGCRCVDDGVGGVVDEKKKKILLLAKYQFLLLQPLWFSLLILAIRLS